MSVSVTLYVDNVSTFIVGKLPSDVYQGLKKLLGYIPEGAIFKMRNSKGRWNGIESTVCYSKKYCKCAIKKDGTHFPTGLLNKAKEYLREKGIKLKFVDLREKVESNIELSMSEDFQVRDYQKEVVEKAAQRERGIIKAATGAGKTALAANLIQHIGVSPFMFYVTSNDLLVQAKNEFSKFIRYKGVPLKVGMIGGGRFDVQDINVVTVQTAVLACGKKYVRFDEEDSYTLSEEEQDLLSEKRKDILELIRSARGFIGDECQHWSAKSCQIISDYSSSARYRYGASATPFRDQGDDILIDGCFGRSICNISASFLISHPDKYLVKPTIYFVPFKKGFPKKAFHYQQVYKEGIVENNFRNVYIASIAESFAKQGRTVLILVQHIAHGNALENLIDSSVFLRGSNTSKEREEHIEKIRNHKAPITIASTIFDEGIDCRPLDTLILAGGGKSCTRALQRIGRILRPYIDPKGNVKNDAIVIDFLDNCKYLKSHARKRRKIYQTEPEFVINELEIEIW